MWKYDVGGLIPSVLQVASGHPEVGLSPDESLAEEPTKKYKE
jgi:hypothetical protein